jgi:hypothetical protein
MANQYYRITSEKCEMVSETVQEVPISDEVLQRYSVD